MNLTKAKQIWCFLFCAIPTNVEYRYLISIDAHGHLDEFQLYEIILKQPSYLALFKTTFQTKLRALLGAVISLSKEQQIAIYHNLTLPYFKGWDHLLHIVIKTLWKEDCYHQIIDCSHKTITSFQSLLEDIAYTSPNQSSFFITIVYHNHHDHNPPHNPPFAQLNPTNPTFQNHNWMEINTIDNTIRLTIPSYILWQLKWCWTSFLQYDIPEFLSFHFLLSHIFIINMKRRPERHHRMQHVMHNLNLRYVLWNAIDPLHNSKWKTRYLEDRHKYSNFISMGAYGVLKTNIAILTYAIHHNLPYLLLLEDDVCFHKQFHTKFTAIMQQLPLDWDIVYLGKKQYDARSYRSHEPDSEHEPAPFSLVNRKTTGWHAVLLKQTVFHEIRKLYQHSLNIPIDESVKTLYFSGQFKAYVLQEDLIITLCAPHSCSDIQPATKHNAETYDYWGWDKENYELALEQLCA